MFLTYQGGGKNYTWAEIEGKGTTVNYQSDNFWGTDLGGTAGLTRGSGPDEVVPIPGFANLSIPDFSNGINREVEYSPTSNYFPGNFSAFEDAITKDVMYGHSVNLSIPFKDLRAYVSPNVPSQVTITVVYGDNLSTPARTPYPLIRVSLAGLAKSAFLGSHLAMTGPRQPFSTSGVIMTWVGNWVGHIATDLLPVVEAEVRGEWYSYYCWNLSITIQVATQTYMGALRLTGGDGGDESEASSMLGFECLNLGEIEDE